ncbi:MAG: InlB B-repeat-containing protein, partial [Adlercreutzia equolifaciens]
MNGASTVAEFNTTKLIAALSPAGSEAEFAWSSDDSSVATVDRNGTVTGVSAGTTTIRATITKADGSTVSAAHVITVTRSNSRTPAIFYYLKTPTSDPNSNDTGQWGPSLGYGKIDVAGAVWVNNKNCYVSSQPNRVVEWPENVPGGVVPEGTDTWNDIFNEYKETVEGGNVTEEDIESITLVPYKISNNDDGYHVDCQVVVKAKGLATARFYLWDAGATAYEYKGGETVREGKTVSVPGSVSSLPETKTADGRTYRLVAWRTDRSLTGSDVAFPTLSLRMWTSAKYVADYIVTYELDGGSWSANPKTLYAAGDMVTVANEQPQKAGYEFAGWKKSTDESTVRPGDIFSMPEADVTLAAQWTPIKYTVEYDLANGTLQDSTEKTSYSDLLYGDNTPTIKNPVRWGYTFRDWDPVVSETVTGNATYVAQWEPVQYTFTIVAKSDSLTYDGKYHGAAGLQGVEPIPGRNGEQGVMVQVGEETFYITGYSAVVSDERAENGQVKDAGEYTLSPQAGGNVVIYDSEGKVFDNGKNPTINLVDGKLTINKRSVTLTSATDSKPYDGTALTNHNVTVGGDGFIEGHGATYSFTGSQTLVGNSANAFTYTLTGEGCTEGEGGNYAITTTEGDLAVSKKSIDETPNPDDGTVTPVLDVNYVNSVVYDGQDQTPTMTVIDRDNKNTLTSADYTVEFQRDGVKTDDLTTAGPITIVITGQGNYEG